MLWRESACRTCFSSPAFFDIGQNIQSVQKCAEAKIAPFLPLIIPVPYTDFQQNIGPPAAVETLEKKGRARYAMFVELVFIQNFTRAIQYVYPLQSHLKHAKNSSSLPSCPVWEEYFNRSLSKTFLACSKMVFHRSPKRVR